MPIYCLDDKKFGLQCSMITSNQRGMVIHAIDAKFR